MATGTGSSTELAEEDPSLKNDMDRSSEARYMYLSYFFAAWGDRMWEFAGIVFLMDVFPSTLLPASLFGFCETLAGIISGTPVGGFIDSSDRLVVLRTSIVGQNVVICFAGIVFWAVLFFADRVGFEARCGVVAVIVAAGMAARVFAAMNKISIHKDWTVAIAGGDPGFQALLNAGMRRVDLVCSILAPLLVGGLSSFFSSAVACAVIAVWSACSLFIELYLSRVVYSRVPALRVPKPRRTAPRKSGNALENWYSAQVDNFSAFLRHRVLFVSVPYCLLYMSVLSFHGTMVSFLRSIGVTDIWLAAGRAAAALIAIGSTFAIPPMRRSLGLPKTGLITLWLQIIFLAPLAVAFTTYARTVEAQQGLGFLALLFAALSLSRFGLWGFDLVETQMMQEMVEPQRAGVINGAQETLINGCWLVSFTFTMVFHRPDQFAFPVVFSFIALYSAGILFTKHYLARKSLLAMAPEARMPTSLVKFALFPEYRPEVAQPLKEDLPFTLADVKAVIPKECFTANMWLSWYYIARDLTQFAVAAVVAYVALSFIEAPWLRAAVWALYVLAQGSTGFGMWVIGHECGHQAYFGDRRNLNDLVGFLIHSAFLTPYHSWRITHATHHRYTNHTEKDTAFPPKEYPGSFFHIGEYFPPLHLLLVLGYLLYGFPGYLLLNLEGHRHPWGCSHFRPSSPIFTEKQRNLIWLSDAGFLAMAGFVYLAAQKWGAFNVFMWYGLPVLATFAWLVLVTFLQHADKRAPHYDEEDNFDFLKGALCTVDRNYGLWNNWMHHITDAHVVHHLFSHMPFYHAKTATPYVRKFCGEHYLYDARPLPVQLWESWFVHQSSFLHSKKWKAAQVKKKQ